jgi:hypothetical protein
MRFLTSKTWTFAAGLALACTIVPFSISSAVGAPSSLTTPSPQGNVKVRGSEEATPAPITYSTLDGIWEVQAQPGGQAVYSHLHLLMSGDTITGNWERDKIKTPISGTQTNDRFTINGADAKGPFTMSGYIENSATFIGQITQGRTNTAFTASHQGLPLNERPQKKHHHERKHKHSHAHSPALAPPDSQDDATPTPTPSEQ